jgi:hypothetical protein
MVAGDLDLPDSLFRLSPRCSSCCSWARGPILIALVLAAASARVVSGWRGWAYSDNFQQAAASPCYWVGFDGVRDGTGATQRSRTLTQSRQVSPGLTKTHQAQRVSQVSAGLPFRSRKCADLVACRCLSVACQCLFTYTACRVADRLPAICD